MPRNNFLLCLIILTSLFFLLACEGDVSSLDEDEFGSLDTAAIMLSVEWPDEAGTTEDRDVAGIVGEEDAYGARMAASPITLSDNCTSRGVDKVRVEVRSSSGDTLKSATFDCSTGQGTLRGVKPQSGCAIIVSGLNSTGTAIYRGSKTNVTLHAGMNNAGRIQVEPLYTGQHTVTASAGTGGSVSPSSRSVASGSTASFTVSGDRPSHIINPTVGGTCPIGSWSDNVYMTDEISGDCSVDFSFDQVEIKVTDHKLLYYFMNKDAVDQGFDPLLAVNVTMFRFEFNGLTYDLSDYLDDSDPQGVKIKTYDDMLSNLNAALDQLILNTPSGPFREELADLRFSLGNAFTVIHPDNGRHLIGKAIVLTSPGKYNLDAREWWVQIPPAQENIIINGLIVPNRNRYELVDVQKGIAYQEIIPSG